MKNLILSLGAILTLGSCEDVITLDIQNGVEQLVVDGWLTTKYEDQVIKLTYSQPYFDNSDPRGVIGADVIVFESDSTAHVFKDLKGNGLYVLSKNETGFLKLNGQYTLYIKHEKNQFSAISKLTRVPSIDSISYEYFDFPFARQDSSETTGYFAEFYAKDPIGEGDRYWIKTRKNGKLLNKPSQISVAYDAGFSPGSKSDGLLFIQPIRQSINDGFYQDKDSIYVELWSISPDAFYYLLQVRQESGNGGIFATPPANIPTNIFNINSSSQKKALGFFCVSGVSTLSAVLNSNRARPKK
jgi:hypothetical protein